MREFWWSGKRRAPDAPGLADATPAPLPDPLVRPGAMRPQDVRPGRHGPQPDRRGPRPDPLTPVPTSGTQRRTTHMAASLLLAYPDEEVLGAAREVRAVVGRLPGPVRERLVAFCDVLDAAAQVPPGSPGDLQDLQARYVATFDLKRRCAMYLSYYAAGDTRKRGTSLVRFVEAYRAAGWEISGGELPDHLPTVLEFSARATGEDAAIAAGLLGSHRDGIEVLRTALLGMDSPWAGLVEAVCLTLGPLDAETERRYTELVTAGPPTEMVGLTALGPAETGPLEPFTPAGASNGEVRR